MALYLQEFAPNLPLKNLADVIAFNQQHASSVLVLFGQELFEQAQAKGPLASAAYRKALADGHRHARALGIDAILRRKRLHALIAPTGEPAWLIDTVNGDSGGGASATSPPAVAGYPHLTVPMGSVGGLPVGLSFIGPAWSDVRLLQYGHAYEQATKRRKPPTYKVSSVQR
jgi:amidase